MRSSIFWASGGMWTRKIPGCRPELEALGDDLVRGEHELFDEPVRDVARRREDGLDLAELAEQDLALRQVEVDRPPRLAPLPQDLEELVHPPEVVQQRRVALEELGRRLGEDRVDVRVRHPLLRADHGAVELLLEKPSVPVDLDLGRERQPVHARVERADPVGEALGQHRNGAAGEVDRGRPLERFAIDRRPFPDVVRDVGDVDAEAVVAVRKDRDIDGVVEVLRRLPVDGDDVPPAQIDPRADLRRVDLLGDGVRRRENVGRELVRDVELPDDDLDVDARLAEHAQFLDHAAERERFGAGIALDVDVDHLALARAHRRARIDLDVLVEAGVERAKEGRGRLMEAADDRAVLPLEDARDLSLEILPLAEHFHLRAARVETDQNDVAVHRPCHLPPVDVEIGLSFRPVNDSVPLREDADLPRAEARELEKGVALAAGGDERAGALEPLDGGLDALARDRGVAQPVVDVLDGEDAASLRAEERKDALAQRFIGSVRHGGTVCKRRCRSLLGDPLAGGNAGGGGLFRGGTARPERGDVPVETRLGAELVVDRVAVNPQKQRGARHVSLVLGHRDADVLALERFHRLLEGDAVGDELANDLR